MQIPQVHRFLSILKIRFKIKIMASKLTGTSSTDDDIVKVPSFQEATFFLTI